MPDDMIPKSHMARLRLAALNNPLVQPARRRRDLRQIFAAAEQEVQADQPEVRDAGNAVLTLAQIVKTYGQGEGAVPVLRRANLTIERGQIVGLIGPSGSGKSTLLQIAGLLDSPTQGQIEIAGRTAQDLRDRERTLLRRDTLGFVYQFHHLLKEFSAWENVMMPQRLAGVSLAEARERAFYLLDKVGLGHRADHRPAKLSGGEQQRVAIARALANRPALLLADEPTGNLDPETAETVFQLLLDLAREEGMAALIVTHNLALGARMDRRVQLKQGQVYEVTDAAVQEGAMLKNQGRLDEDSHA